MRVELLRSTQDTPQKRDAIQLTKLLNTSKPKNKRLLKVQSFHKLVSHIFCGGVLSKFSKESKEMGTTQDKLQQTTYAR